MYEDKTIVDSQGNIVEAHVLSKNGLLEYYELKEGEYVVDYFNKTHIINGQYVAYLKPKWNGTEWIESATEKEIKTWQDENNIVYEHEPTLEEKYAELELCVLELAEIVGGMQ